MISHALTYFLLDKLALTTSNAIVLCYAVAYQYQASLHFCSECNNLLYPKADPDRRVMVYACRICAYDEIGENQCVYRNDLLTVTKYVCHSPDAHTLDFGMGVIVD